MAEYVSIVGRIRRLVRPGDAHPEHPIAEPEPPVDPGYGISVEHPEHPIYSPPVIWPDPPAPPPGIWPPLTPAHPIAPVPPGLELPPGSIWPEPGHPAHPIATPPPGQPAHPIVLPPQKLVVLVYIPGYGYRYVVVDPSLEVTPHR